MTDAYAQGLRELADFYEAHPDFPRPKYDRTINVSLWTGADAPETKEQVADLARELAPCTKDASGSAYTLKRDFAGGANRTVAGYSCGACYSYVPADRNDPAWAPCVKNGWAHTVSSYGGVGDHEFPGFGVTLNVSVKRELVCEKKVVGKRYVSAFPAMAGHYEEEVEWSCPESLLS